MFTPKSPKLTPIKERYAAVISEGIGERIEKVAGKVGGKRLLAQRAGVAESSLYRYIGGDGDPSLPILQRIAEAGDVSINWLMHGDEQITPLPSSVSPSIREQQEKIVKTLQDRIQSLLSGPLDTDALAQLKQLNESLETALRTLNQLSG